MIRLAILVFAVLLISCTPAPINYESIARNTVLDGETYMFDGRQLTLVNQTPSTFVYLFASRSPGYGDRENKPLPKQEILHTVVVVMNETKVESLIIDGVWDELSQKSTIPIVILEGKALSKTSCAKDLPAPFAVFREKTLMITAFAPSDDSCGEHSYNVNSGGGHPPTLIVDIKKENHNCPPPQANCNPIGAIPISIQDPGIFGDIEVQLDGDTLGVIPFYSFTCLNSTLECPDGMECVIQEGNTEGQCIIAGSENDELEVAAEYSIQLEKDSLN